MTPAPPGPKDVELIAPLKLSAQSGRGGPVDYPKGAVGKVLGKGTWVSDYRKKTGLARIYMVRFEDGACVQVYQDEMKKASRAFQLQPKVYPVPPARPALSFDTPAPAEPDPPKPKSAPKPEKQLSLLEI